MKVQDQHNVPFELIAKYLANEVNDAERQQVMDWVLDNEDEFERIVQSWEKTEEAINAPAIDVDKAWKQVQTQIVAQESTKKQQTRWLRPQILRIAAAVVILFGLGWAILNILAPDLFVPTQLEIAEAETKDLELEDGSRITLNTYTQLTFPEKFSKSQREVKLTGEAFFDVAHDEEKPFVVLTNELQIRVLGTSFNVDSRDENDSITVTVASGTVEVAIMEKGRKIMIDTLRANDQIKYVKLSGNLLEKETPTPNYSLWKTGELRYNKISVQKLAEVLSDQYGVEIAVDPNIRDCELRAASFKPNQEQLKDALRKVSGDNSFFKYEYVAGDSKSLEFLPADLSCD